MGQHARRSARKIRQADHLQQRVHVLQHDLLPAGAVRHRRAAVAEPDVHGDHYHQHRHRHRAGDPLEAYARKAEYPRFAQGRRRPRRQAQYGWHRNARARRYRGVRRRKPDLCGRCGGGRGVLRERGAHHRRVGRDQKAARRPAPLRQLHREWSLPRAADRRRRGFLRLAPDAGGQAGQKAADLRNDALAAKSREVDRRDRYSTGRHHVHQGIHLAGSGHPRCRDLHGRLDHRHDSGGAVPADEPCARRGRGASGAAQNAGA